MIGSLDVDHHAHGPGPRSGVLAPQASGTVPSPRSPKPFPGALPSYQQHTWQFAAGRSASSSARSGRSAQRQNEGRPEAAHQPAPHLPGGVHIVGNVTQYPSRRPSANSKQAAARSTYSLQPSMVVTGPTLMPATSPDASLSPPVNIALLQPPAANVPPSSARPGPSYIFQNATRPAMQAAAQAGIIERSALSSPFPRPLSSSAAEGPAAALESCQTALPSFPRAGAGARMWDGGAAPCDEGSLPWRIVVRWHRRRKLSRAFAAWQWLVARNLRRWRIAQQRQRRAAAELLGACFAAWHGVVDQAKEQRHAEQHEALLALAREQHSIVEQLQEDLRELQQQQQEEQEQEQPGGRAFHEALQQAAQRRDELAARQAWLRVVAWRERRAKRAAWRAWQAFVARRRWLAAIRSKMARCYLARVFGAWLWAVAEAKAQAEQGQVDTGGGAEGGLSVLPAHDGGDSGAAAAERADGGEATAASDKAWRRSAVWHARRTLRLAFTGWQLFVEQRLWQRAKQRKMRRKRLTWAFTAWCDVALELAAARTALLQQGVAGEALGDEAEVQAGVLGLADGQGSCNPMDDTAIPGNSSNDVDGGGCGRWEDPGAGAEVEGWGAQVGDEQGALEAMQREGEGQGQEGVAGEEEGSAAQGARGSAAAGNEEGWANERGGGEGGAPGEAYDGEQGAGEEGDGGEGHEEATCEGYAEGGNERYDEPGNEGYEEAGNEGYEGTEGEGEQYDEGK